MMKTKMRGAVGAANFQPASAWQSLWDAGANIVRYQLIVFDRSTGEEWKNQIRSYLDHMDAILLPTVTTQRVVLDIHWTPGQDADFWDNTALQDTLIEMWVEIAGRYKDNYKVYAYGILNEPLGEKVQVRNLMQRAVDEIRKVDERKMIMVTPRASDPNNLKTFDPIVGKNLYYEFHFYRASAFCGQGVNNLPTGKVYPTSSFNKDTLRRWLQPARDFQLKYNKQIYVGEFAASVYTESQSRINWNTDVISIFEDYAWQYTFMAWREFEGWTLEQDDAFFTFIKSVWSKNS